MSAVGFSRKEDLELERKASIVTKALNVIQDSVMHACGEELETCEVVFTNMDQDRAVGVSFIPKRNELELSIAKHPRTMTKITGEMLEQDDLSKLVDIVEKNLGLDYTNYIVKNREYLIKKAFLYKLRNQLPDYREVVFTSTSIEYKPIVHRYPYKLFKQPHKSKNVYRNIANYVKTVYVYGYIDLCRELPSIAARFINYLKKISFEKYTVAKEIAEEILNTYMKHEVMKNQRQEIFVNIFSEQYSSKIRIERIKPPGNVSVSESLYLNVLSIFTFNIHPYKLEVGSVNIPISLLTEASFPKILKTIDARTRLTSKLTKLFIDTFAKYLDEFMQKYPKEVFEKRKEEIAEYICKYLFEKEKLSEETVEKLEKMKRLLERNNTSISIQFREVSYRPPKIEYYFKKNIISRN